MSAVPVIIYVALSIVSFVNCQSLDQVVQCSTPSGDFGSCILLEACQSLVRLVSSGATSVEVLRRSQCGFVGAKPKVCCANNPKPIIFPAAGATTSTADGPVATQKTETVVFPTTAGNASDNAQFPQLQKSPPDLENAAPGNSIGNIESGNAAKEEPKSTTFTPNMVGGFAQPVGGVARPVGGVARPVGGVAQPVRADQLPGTDTCGTVTIANKIYGGENTSIDDFPWMALLKYRKANSEEHYGCGGVLLNQRYVLTAAHCVRTVSAHTLFQVRLGEWDLSSEVDCASPTECNTPPVDVDIEESVYHADFEARNYTNDVALLRLKHDVTYTDWVQPICLPGSEDRDFTDENFWVAGWGKTENGETSPVKQKLEVRHAEIETCRAAYRRLRITLGNGTLCAGGKPGQDTCAGDSGAPLMKLLPSSTTMANFYTVGIVSLGPSRCGMEGWPGVYTKVSHYVDWIKANMKP